MSSLHTLNSTANGKDKVSEKRQQRNSRDHLSRNKEENNTNWRVQTTGRKQDNWRTPRDQPTTQRNAYRSSNNHHNPSSSRYPDGNRFNCLRNDNDSLETRNLDKTRKRKYEDNSNKDQSQQSDPTSAKRFRATSSAARGRHNSYSNQERQEKHYRDSNESHYTKYNNNQYSSSNSNYSHNSTRPHTTATKTDNKMKRPLRTDYYNDPRTSSSKRGGKSSQYPQRRQEQ